MTGVMRPSRASHRAVHLPGLHAYPGEISVAAGEEIGFHVSSTVPYRFSVCQLGPDPEDASRDVVLHTEVRHSGQPQAIHPGSYVFVDRGLPAGSLSAFTLECWLMPWGFGHRQAILTQYDESRRRGFALFIEADGRLAFRCGAHEEQTLPGPRLVEREWVHLVAVMDAGAMALWVDGQNVAQASGPAACDLETAALCLGASPVGGRMQDFLDADIVMPVIYGRALGSAEIAARGEQRGLEAARGSGVLACWPLDEERGERVRDASGNEHHGQIINHATWMITGPAFDSARVPRFSSREGAYEPAADGTRGHGLRLASDDLVDCGWSESHRVRIPCDAKPGIHVGRFEFDFEGEPVRYDVSFIVRRAQHAEPAALLVLCATNSWRAYASSPFARNRPGPAHWPRKAAPLPNSHPEAPDYNHYTPHRKGQPTYYAGLRMPWPNAAPDAFYAPEGSGFSHGPGLERRLHGWLDREGYPYDVVSDLDLHRHPGMLHRYRSVIINGHSEYWSEPAYQGLDAYLRGGGSAVVLSGNTMYWRVSFDEEGAVMEQRKTLTPPDAPHGSMEKHAAPGGAHGEQYHSQDGKRGGLWRFNDRSCSEVIGLETAGWAFADAEDFGVYRVRDAAHFLFRVPEETGLGAGDTFGHGPGGSLPRAIGHEWDLTIATLRRMTHRVPAGAELPRAQQGLQVIAEGVRRVPGKLDAYLDFFEGATQSLDGLSAEMIYWERPQGGRVFNAGAVGASWVLGADEQFGTLLRNVLHHFGVSRA